MQTDSTSSSMPPQTAPSGDEPDGSTFARTDRDSGLSSDQVETLRARFGRNVVDSRVRRTWWGTLREILSEPMFLLLLAATIIYLLIGDKIEALTLFAFVALVVLLTVFQSHRTARVLDSLRELSAPRAHVLRDGRRQLVSAADLVPGDCVFVEEGTRVPADGVVTEAHELSVDESLLTGESVPVDKYAFGSGTESQDEAQDEAQTRLFFGSMVSRGQARMTVTSTGPNTALGRIGKSLTSIADATSPLQLETRTFVNRFAVAAIMLCLLLIGAHHWRYGEWLAAVLAGITLAMGILPQEIPVILTVFMALGARRIANEGMLTRRMSAIETLGQTSVLCVDKTGTLTQNRMSVHALWVPDRQQIIEPTTRHIDERYHELIEYLVLASEIEPVDPMERAFHETGNARLAGTGRLHGDWSLVHEYALTPALPAMSHGWHAPGTDTRTVACKGAPEAVCTLCRLTESQAQGILERAAQMASNGLRVLGVARANHDGPDWPERQHDFAFTFVGLVGLLDPVRPDVAGAIRECHAAGIRVVMVTGDYPSTARAIATEVGIDGRHVATGRELASMSDAQLRERMTGIDVFARITPEQKLRLVDAFRERGEVVAMTGDGVNDAPALKAADIGVAMGLRGTEVAREVASLVLLRDDFAPIVSAIRLGRRIYANLVQAISYTVAVHIPMIAATVLPVLFGLPSILGPIHVVFLELIINPVCSVVFENEPARDDLMRMPPRRAGTRLLSRRTLVQSVMAGSSIALIVIVIYAGLLAYGYAPALVRTFAFVSLVVGNVGLIFIVRMLQHSGKRTAAQPRNAYLSIVLVVTGAALLLLMTVPTLAGLFGLVALLRF